MDEWKPVNQNLNRGVALYFFQPTGIPNALCANPGDGLVILKETTNWVSAYKLGYADKVGIIPRSYIHVCKLKDDILLLGQESVSLYEESTVILKDSLKSLYAAFFEGKMDICSRTYQLYDEIFQDRLDFGGDCVISEWNIIRDSMEDRLNEIAKLLKLDMIVRRNFMPLSFDHPFAYELFELYNKAFTKDSNTSMDGLSSKGSYEMTINTVKFSQNIFEAQQANKIANVYVEIFKPVVKFNCSYEFSFSIFAAQSPCQYLSDSFTLYMKDGEIMTKSKADNDFNSQQILFSELKSSDIFRNLLLVSKVYRLGKIEKDKKDHNGRHLVSSAVQTISAINDNPGQKFRFTLSYHGITGSDVGKIEEFLLSKTSKNAAHTVDVDVALYYGNLSYVQKEFPSLFERSIVLVRPCDFHELLTVAAGKSRSDIYIRLREAYIEKHGKASKLNLEVSVSVVRSNGQIIADSIYTSDNLPSCTEYKSCISMHTNNPEFCDIIRISLKENYLEDCHVRFVFNHLSTKDKNSGNNSGFSFTVLKLKDANTNVFIADTLHKLHVFKIDNTVDFRKVKDYLKWKFIDDGTPGSPTPSKDFLRVETKLVATNLTTNPHIQALRCPFAKLNTIDYNIVFDNLLYVSDIEKLRFFTEMVFCVCNLIERLDINHTKPFQVVFSVLALVSDKKYSQYQNQFFTNLNKLEAPNFHEKIKVFMLNKLNDVKNLSRDIVRNFLRGAAFLVVLITRSFESSNSKKDIKPKQKVLEVLGGILHKLCESLRSDDDGIFAIKIEALNSYPQIIYDCKEYFTLSEVCSLLEHLSDGIFDFLKNPNSSARITQSKNLVRFGEKYLISLLNLSYLDDQDFRSWLIPYIFNQLERFQNFCSPDAYTISMGKIIGYLEKNEGGSDVNIVCLLLKWVYYILKKFYLNTSSTKDTISSKENLGSSSVQFAKLRPQIEAVLISLFSMIDKNTFFEFFKDKKVEEKLLIMINIIRFFIIMLKNMLTMSNSPLCVVSCNIMSRMVLFFLAAMSNNGNFIYNSLIVSRLLNFTLNFLWCPALSIESFSPYKREKILNQLGDLRLKLLKIITYMWMELKEHRREYFSVFIYRLVEVSKTTEKSLREAVIFFIIRTVEFEANNPAILSSLETTFISAIDCYLDTSTQINEYCDQFVLLCSNLVSLIKDKKISLVVKDFSDRIHKALSILSELKLSPEDAAICRTLSDICSYKLAVYYRSIGSDELYTKKLYNISTVQEKLNNHMEAACALYEYGKSLKWSNKMLLEDENYTAETEKSRKDTIYRSCLRFFYNAKCYEKCIEVSNKLLEHYMEEYSYRNCSEQYNLLSQFYNLIITEARAEPEYFLVGFYGVNFHKAIRNKEFIHRGKDFMKLGDIITRLRSDFPDAEVSGTPGQIDENILTSEKKKIFCTGVTALPADIPLLKSYEAVDEIKAFYLKNDIKTFTRQRAFVRTEEVHKKWVEEISYVAEFVFPGSSEWSMVVETNTRKISPIETAIKDVTNKSTTLEKLMKKQLTDPNAKSTELCSLLNGIIDSAVNGGTGMYCTAFLVESYLKENPVDSDKVTGLKNALADQVNLTNKAMVLQEDVISADFRGLHDKMIEMFESMRESLEKYTGITLEKLNLITSEAKDELSLRKKSNEPSTDTSGKLTDTPQRKNTDDKNTGKHFSPQVIPVNSPGRIRSGSKRDELTDIKSRGASIINTGTAGFAYIPNIGSNITKTADRKSSKATSKEQSDTKKKYERKKSRLIKNKSNNAAE